MQFGRIHGFALFVLGLLLIALQIDFAFTGRSVAETPPQPSLTENQQPQSRHLGPVAGILGTVALVGGIVIFATARRRSEAPGDRAVK